MRSAGKPLAGALLNRAHPLARGTISDWILNEGAGRRANAVGRKASSALAVGGVTWGGGRSGTAPKFNGTSGYFDTDATNTLRLELLNVPWTIATRFKCSQVSSATTNAVLGRGGTSGGNTRDYFLGINAGTFFAQRSNGSAFPTVQTAALYSNNVEYTVVVTFDGTTGRIYVNGKLVTSASLATTITSNSARRTTIGAFRDGGGGTINSFFNGTIDHVYLRDFAWGSAEVQMHYANPYAMFEQPAFRLKTGGASTAAGAPVAAAGVATVAAVGRSTAAAAPTAAAGVATVAATGRATSAATASTAAGAATTAATGRSTAAGVGTAAGVASVAVTGSSTAATSGLASGAANVVGTGASTAAASAVAAGAATCAVGGAGIAAAVASASGSATVAATGGAIFTATPGAAAGSCTVAASGSVLNAADGTAAGTSTVAATGAAVYGASGTAAGTCITAAVGSYLGTLVTDGPAGGGFAPRPNPQTRPGMESTTRPAQGISTRPTSSASTRPRSSNTRR